MNWNFLYHSYDRRDFCKRIAGAVVKTVSGLYVVEKAADIAKAGPPPPVLRQRMVKQARIITPAAETLLVSIAESEDNADLLVGYTGRFGQFGTWAPAGACVVTKVEIYLNRGGTLGGTQVYTASIYNSDASEEVGASTNNYNHDSISATSGYVPFTFNPVSLSAATYWFGVWSAGESGSKYLNIRYDNTNTRSTRMSETAKASPSWVSLDASSAMRMKIYGY